MTEIQSDQCRLRAAKRSEGIIKIIWIDEQMYRLDGTKCTAPRYIPFEVRENKMILATTHTKFLMDNFS